MVYDYFLELFILRDLVFFGCRVTILYLIGFFSCFEHKIHIVSIGKICKYGSECEKMWVFFCGILVDHLLVRKLHHLFI